MTKTLGLIVAPGVTERLGQDLARELPEMLDRLEVNRTEWQVELVVDALTGFAESADRIFKDINAYHHKAHWDYVLALTDLPLFYEQEVLALDINTDSGSAVVFYPAYGWRPVKKRLERTIVQVVEMLQSEQFEREPYDSDARMMPTLNRQFPLTRVKKHYHYREETKAYHICYTASSKGMGMFRLVTGMTFANNPLHMMSSLSSVVAIAFTTGAFGMVFSTMWQMSLLFSPWRLASITIMAIFGMLIWVMTAHQLWEPVRNRKHSRIILLYNFTTVLTLLIAIVIYYFTLYFFFLIAAIVLLPPAFLGEQVGLNHAAGIGLYLSIPWFAASISTVAGAIGAGLLNEQVVKESTYGYRQRLRYEHKA
nr:5,10-methylene-tetrahydrofolate dehydrogenase [Staphylococcus canis]